MEVAEFVGLRFDVALFNPFAGTITDSAGYKLTYIAFHVRRG
jgi:hypothetical protein